MPYGINYEQILNSLVVKLVRAVPGNQLEVRNDLNIYG